MNIVDCVLLVCNRLNSWAELRGRKGFPTTYRCLVNFVHSKVEFYSSDTGDRHASTSQKHGTYAARYEPHSCHLIFQLDAIGNNKVFSFSSSSWIRVLLLIGAMPKLSMKDDVLDSGRHSTAHNAHQSVQSSSQIAALRFLLGETGMHLISTPDSNTEIFFRSRHISSTLT